MVLISIQPFHFVKLFVFGAALLFLSSAFCSGDPLFMSMKAPLSNHSGHRNQVSVGRQSSAHSETQPQSSIDFWSQLAAISSQGEHSRTFTLAGMGTWLDASEMEPAWVASDFLR
jgi:hypothetical protein